MTWRLMDADLDLGQTVEWTSSANGGTRTKRGEIVEIVEPYYYPSTEWHAGKRHYGPFRVNGWPLAPTRHRRSYVVRVIPGPRSKAHYYWPRPTALKKVTNG